MATVSELHPQAMDLAEEAFLARRRGLEEEAHALFREALELEVQAADLLPGDQVSEPTRSILYRSAASLAFNAGDYDRAEQLIGRGLAGFPPTQIRDELRNLYEDVTFMHHLSLRGIALAEDQLQMVIAGNATSYGGARADQLMTRLKNITTIFYRTIERLKKKPYRTSGGVSKDIKDEYELYVNAFAPGSFGVTLQLGRPDPQVDAFPDFERDRDLDPSVVIDEVMRCFEILEGEHPDDLRYQFGDEVYYENFLALAKQMAPDGEDVKLVGLTHVRHGRERPVTLRKSAKDLREAEVEDAPVEQAVAVRREYTGIVHHADSPLTGRQYGTVKLVDDESGADFTLRVPLAMMKDVVQPFYEESVTVVVSEVNGHLYLDDISPA